jgi:HPt (histidine-containing phosphotransfer) domain-containing protein
MLLSAIELWAAPVSATGELLTPLEQQQSESVARPTGALRRTGLLRAANFPRQTGALRSAPTPAPPPAEASSNPQAKTSSDNGSQPGHRAVLEEALFSHQHSPMDYDEALPRFLDDPGFLESMLGEFLEHLPERFQEMEAAIQHADAASLHHLGHNLKGAASNFSARPLVALAQELEQSAKNGDIAGAPELLQRMQVEAQRLAGFLKQLQTIP